MARWAFLLGGLLVWTAHFVGVYAVASVGDVMGEADSAGVRLVIGGLTAACLAVDALVLAAAVRRWSPVMPPGDQDVVGFWRAVGGAGALLSAAAVLWQALPALLD